MAVVQNLYKIFKIPASMLVEHDCSMEYTVTQGLKDGNIVSIGDNIVFQQLRYMHGDRRDHHEMFSYIQKLRSNQHRYKRQGKFKEAAILDRAITDKLFVTDIVNVVVDGKKSDFNKFRVSGFDFNGRHYLYLCSGSGQIRRNTATFVAEEYRDRLVKTLNCGLDEKTTQFVLAKYTAYFALAFSSILWVRTPRVCVIKDFHHTVKDQPVDFIVKDANGDSVIEKRVMDLDLNCADGQGLIDPEFAKLWASDMDLRYVPCSFVARSCFVKGNLVSFDFKGYAHEHGISVIRDKWGNEHQVDDVDVLLSESQFKVAKYFSSWEEYSSYAERGEIHWGVARYNKETDDEWVLSNYQYIQSLSLTKEDISALIKPTVEWINQICSGDFLYAMLFAFGSKSEGIEYGPLYGSAQTTPMKALVKNPAFLKDSYIQRKMYKSIAESINHAKIGKIWIRGNYQFMISDPVAQAQSALGLDPVGCLKADEIYSKFWDDRGGGARMTVDCCRSPMIDVHEHNPMTSVPASESPEAARWLSHIYSGIVYNTYDTSTFRHEDSDFDGDICLTTDNPYFIKGSHKDHSIITYEKGLATPSKMTVQNITATVAKGFGSGVGGFSNTATILYAMSAIFDKPGHEDQYQTIMGRIKLLREIVGQEIDRIKGADKPSLPKSWRAFEPIAASDSPEERTRKMRQNAMVISKKPYFFRYLYPELNRKFKQFEDSYNQISRDMFGIKFKKLLKKEEKTEEERNLIRKYQKYCPLITAPCTMNNLCRQFEDTDFDIKYDKDAPQSMLPTFEAELAGSFSQEKMSAVRAAYQAYSSKKAIKSMDSLLGDSLVSVPDREYHEIRSLTYDAMIDGLRADISKASVTPKEFLFYCHRASKAYSKFNWAFAWDILGDQILPLIPQGDSLCPIRDPNGDAEYLGRRYSLKRLDPERPYGDRPESGILYMAPDPEFDALVDAMIDGIFGSDWEQRDGSPSPYPTPESTPSADGSGQQQQQQQEDDKTHDKHDDNDGQDASGNR